MLHMTLDGSLQRMGQELGKAVEEMSYPEGPVKHHCLGVGGGELRQDLKYTLQGNTHTQGWKINTQIFFK